MKYQDLGLHFEINNTRYHLFFKNPDFSVEITAYGFCNRGDTIIRNKSQIIQHANKFSHLTKRTIVNIIDI